MSQKVCRLTAHPQCFRSSVFAGVQRTRTLNTQPLQLSRIQHHVLGSKRVAVGRISLVCASSSASDRDLRIDLNSARSGNGAGKLLGRSAETPVDGLKWTSVPAGVIETSSVDLDDSSAPPFPINCSQLHIKNQVQLSTYSNCIGEDLQDLTAFMSSNFEGAIGGLHLLPIYPSSGDGGFAPITYTEVDPELGTWQDVEQLAKKYDMCLEFMVNHLSPKSEQFQDFLEHGDASPYAEMFIDWHKFWPKGEPTQTDLELIRTRKDSMPKLAVEMADGSIRDVWSTFGPEQIDFDPASVPGSEFVRTSLLSLMERGVKMIRLDAIGYATKKPGTKCFFEEPKVWKLLDGLNKLAKDLDIGLLCEVHEDYGTNLALAKRGYWVYDFALPLLILHAFAFETAENLRSWITQCPRRQITVLDTHDGMGIDDIAGLATVCDVTQLQQVVEHSWGCNPNFKYHYDRKTREYIGAPHQFNCTYFSAVGESPRRYLLARAIQFWTPGVPMVYYVGLLAGKNDFESMKSEGHGRAINRHRYSVPEAEEALEQPVVKALLELCRFRNTHPAFNGQVHVGDSKASHMLEVTWINGKHKASLEADMHKLTFSVHATVHGKDGSSNGKLETLRYTLEGGDAMGDDDASWREGFGAALNEECVLDAVSSMV